MPKARIFFIMQYLKHPKTGEVLLTEEKIQEALDHRTIKDWAYVLHDKDYWNDEDELDDPNHPSGEPKPPHWHIAINMPKNATEIDVIAKWFDIPSNFVEMKRGRGAFLDCVEYLTHESMKQQELGKYRYDDNEIKTNFDFRAAINERNISRSRYGTELTKKEQLRMQILNGEMTLNQVKKEYSLNYIQDMDMLKKLRMEYISDCTPPLVRHNFYVCGGGGVGKGIASICLAHALYPNIEDEEELFFRIGAQETSFMGYDGQPVIIWDDFRSFDLIRVLGTRGNVFNVFDTTPKKQRQNIKYGSINLINAVNIVNSVQDWEEFLCGLVGEYTDKNGNFYQAEDDEKSQSYRRFPFIMPLRADDFDILINKGYMDDTNAFDEYMKYANIVGNFGTLAKALGNSPTTHKISERMVHPLVESVHKVEEKRKKNIENNDIDLSQFDDFGTQKDDNNLPFD